MADLAARPWNRWEQAVLAGLGGECPPRGCRRRPPGQRAQGVLNCDLGRQGPTVLRIFFRIGPVRGSSCVSGELPFSLDGPDRLCRGGSGHQGFHLNQAASSPAWAGA